MVWPIIRGESYVPETGKSMRGMTLVLKRLLAICMVRRRTARGLKLGKGTVCVNVSGLLVEKSLSGHLEKQKSISKSETAPSIALTALVGFGHRTFV
jgi:hypothetical protein